MLRVTIQQPVLPAYRVPVFQELAQRPNIRLKVVYGDRSNSPASVEDAPFDKEFVHMSEFKLLGRKFLWHKPQVGYATRKRSDVLIMSWDIHYTSLIPGLLRAKANGVRTVLWGHGYSKNESALRQRLRDRVGKLADAIMLYDQVTANRCIERGFKASKVFVAPNAIDQSPIQAAREDWLSRPQDLAKFQNEHGLAPGPVILFVSRLEPANRVDLLVQALPALRKRFPDLRVAIIGKGEDEINRLTTMALEKGVTDSIRFLGAVYEEANLAPWFLSSKIFCYPANIGLSILHALGYALPVVTSDRKSAQNPEIVCLQHGKNGLTYQDDNAEDLCKVITELLENESRHRQMSDEAHRTATRAFSLSNMVDGMQAAIEGHP